MNLRYFYFSAFLCIKNKRIYSKVAFCRLWAARVPHSSTAWSNHSFPACCWRDVDAGQNYGFWFLIYFFAGYWSSKVNNSKNSWLTLFFAIWRVSARSGCIGVVEAPRPIYQLFVYIAMHCAIHIVVFLFFYVWCLSKCTTCNRCIVRGEGGGVWAFIEVVEPSVMSWVSRPLPVVRLTGWFSDLLAFFLLDS